MLEILRDPAWQGIGAIAGIVSLIVSIWLAQNPAMWGKLTRNSWRQLAKAISFLLPIYLVFVLSITTVNALTQDAKTVVYYAVALASILGVVWGIVWHRYIRKAFTTTSIQRLPENPSSINN